MTDTIPAPVAASSKGFPFQTGGASGWMRARDLWPLATEAQRASILDICTRYNHYTGEDGDVLSGVWSALGWPIPPHTLTGRA